MIYKIPHIDPLALFEYLKADKDVIEFVRNNPKNKTCLSALLYDKGNIGVLANNGNFVFNQDKKVLKENYLKIDEYTKMYCAPPNRVRGVVNFASPIPLFYSDIADENYKYIDFDTPSNNNFAFTAALKFSGVSSVNLTVT